MNKKVVIGIVIIFIIIISLMFIKFRKKENLNQNLTSSDVTSEQTEKKAVIEEEGDFYNVKVDNEIVYSGSNYGEAEIYKNNPDFDLRLPDF